MKKIILVLLAIVFLATGCAFLEQAKQDYQLGANTPYAEGEITAQERSRVLAGTVSAIPYVNLSSPVVLLAGPYLFAWLRGRRIRKQTLPAHPNPITGAIGKNLGIESIVQHLANVAAGLFEVGPNGSELKRGWKGALLTAVGLVLAPEAGHIISTYLIPALQNNPPEWLAQLFNGSALMAVVGILAAAEKWLSKVQPVEEKQPAGALAAVAA